MKYLFPPTPFTPSFYAVIMQIPRAMEGKKKRFQKKELQTTPPPQPLASKQADTKS